VQAQQLILVLVLLISLAGPSLVRGQQTVLTITTTTSILTDAVKQVGGDFIAVRQLISTGIDPHDFVPTPSNIRTINTSDQVFWIGQGAEESLVQLLQYWQDQGRATAILEQLNSSKLLEGHHAGEHGGTDPHFWMDPMLFANAVQIIANQLSSIDPTHASQYQDNANQYINKLIQLDSQITTQLAEVDPAQRVIVTQHNSLQYFARAYNFTIQSLQGISTETEAGVREVDLLATYLNQHNITVVFTESTTPKQAMQAVVDAARAQRHTVGIGGELLIGSLGTSAATNTYIGMMQHDSQTISSAILNPPQNEQSSLPVRVLLPILAMTGITIIRRRRI